MSLVNWLKEVSTTDMHDRVELILLLIWVISLVGIGLLSHIHFQNKRLEKFRQTADRLMQAYVGFYEQEDLADTEKINRVVTAVVAELKARGFVVNEADVRAIFTAVARIVKENSAQKRKSS